MNILIENVKILTMADGEVIKNGNIYIENEKIKKITSDKIDFSYDKKIDGKNYLAMPGFVNAHTHVGMSLFRNFSDDVELMTWLNEKIWPLEDKLIAEDVYWASLLSHAEMIMTGTTSFADMYYFEDQTIKALEKSKMRAQISRGLTLEDKNYKKIEENIDLFKKYENSQNGRINIAFGPHAVYTTDKNYIKESTVIGLSDRMLEIILENLFLNSIKYRGENPLEIDIIAKENLDTVIVEFKDNGKGIEKSELDKIFNPLYTVDKARTTDKESMGLGLSIVKKILNNVGGDIGVTSEFGQYTVFFIEIPIACKIEMGVK